MFPLQKWRTLDVPALAFGESQGHGFEGLGRLVDTGIASIRA